MIETPATIEVIVPGSGAPIAVTPFRLSFNDQANFEILVNRQDGDGITENIVNQSFSFPYPFGLLPLLGRPGQRVLDLGAHIGTFSLLAANLGYEVAAVEASPRNVALLQASAKHNHLDNLQVIFAAVSDRAGTLNFIESGPYGLVSNAYFDVPALSVQAISVDELLANLGWDHVDLIKMDVEGSEVKAIAGMSKVLERTDVPPILFESNGQTLHYFGETPNSLMAALEAFGYRCYLVERGHFIPLRAAETLFSCTVDCLATKSPPDSLQGWQLSSPLTREMRIGHILAMASFPHPHLRSYIARTLRDAEFDILRDQRVLWSLEQLTKDADAEVRIQAAWFQLEKFRLPLAHKSKYIALLQRFITLGSHLAQRRHGKQ